MKKEIINHKSQEIVTDLKIFPVSYSTKEVQNSSNNNFYSINTLNRKYTCKISEKDCSDINSIVRNSVEKINDLLNSQGFNNSNKKTQKKSNNKNKSMKTNFTFNINNFINVPSQKNDSMNTVNKKERYDDIEDDIWINSNNNNTKNKSNQKRKNNDKIKNRNINYGTNFHNTHNTNDKIFKSSVLGKRKLFEEGINMQFNHNNINSNNNNIKIVDFKKNQKKNKKIQKIKENEKDKSITVNTRYKKYTSGEDYINNINNRISLNNSIKNKNNQENNLNNNDINNNILKYSVSEDINNNTQKKFTPNIISINSLSANQNIKNFIFNNSNIINSKGINKSINNNKSQLKKQINKTYYKSKNSINNSSIKYLKGTKKYNFLEDYKSLLFTEEKNINSNKKISTNIFKKSFSNKNYEKNIIKEINYGKNLNEFSRFTVNKILKKENTSSITSPRRKGGSSCDHRNNINYNSHTHNQNIHKILNKIYYKEFPNKVRTNTIMKLILFMNEYLISNNLLDDYYDINNQKKLENLSKFISQQFNVDFPQQDDVNIDKMINSVKTIQRFWRKQKIKNFLEKNNINKEENELKKMVLNKYIKKAGFKIKKIIGLFNTMVECFDLLENDKEVEEMFYNVQQVIKKKLTPYEKNVLYKEYINNIIYEN